MAMMAITTRSSIKVNPPLGLDTGFFRKIVDRSTAAEILPENCLRCMVENSVKGSTKSIPDVVVGFKICPIGKPPGTRMSVADQNKIWILLTPRMSPTVILREPAEEPASELYLRLLGASWTNLAKVVRWAHTIGDE
jgi:hypothetical protein